MNDKKVSLILGALLHDVNNLLDKNLYVVDDNFLSCIISFASCIASNSDVDETTTAIKPLKSVFNILNGNSESMFYKPQLLSDGINYPTDSVSLTDADLLQIKSALLDDLKLCSYDENGINVVINALENSVSNISEFSNTELQDISLYIHSKMTAAIATCLYDYLVSCGKLDAEIDLNALRDEQAFVLYSMDFSGIQDFIYTIKSKGALRTLRARSFYLEMMMENIIDDLLEKLELSRANLIYSGGGHCYMLLPNSEQIINELKSFNESINEWLVDTFDISLYVAHGFATCSGNTINNVPQGSYSEIFRLVSSAISKQKSRRYSSEVIRRLNKCEDSDYSRECSVCRRHDKLNSDNECQICSAIKTFSNNILKDDLFLVVDKKVAQGVPLPGNKMLIASTYETSELKDLPEYIRVYGKNFYPDLLTDANKIWVGSYSSLNTFEEMAQDSKNNGHIERIGVVRADIDNLGQAFVSGFENNKDTNSNVSILRTAALSRRLSLFFKRHINYLLKESVYSLNDESVHARNATICYSGGDDLFIVGGWDEIIELSIDLREAFIKYTQGSLTFSVGIGVYDSSYPISRMAFETALSEDKSKHITGKDGITLLEDGFEHEENLDLISDGTYKWDVFIAEVIGEKYRVIDDYFKYSDERGMSFLYNLLELIRSQNNRINFARYVYILSRLEPGQKSSQEEKLLYKEFSKKMYEWIKNEKDCRQLKTALTLYSYMNRNSKEA